SSVAQRSKAARSRGRIGIQISVIYRSMVILMRKFLLFLFLCTIANAGDAANACKGDPMHWTPIFDGKDLEGWKHVGPGNMTVEDGLIHTHGGMGLLYWAGGPIGDCRIHVVYRMRDE